jgi:hypothetical protein
MPVSHHIDLYRYWLAKRAGRNMPARRDLDPADIPALLPYMILVDKIDDQFRYRLVGTAVAQEFGHDATGSFVGSYLTAPESAAAALVTYERAFITAYPVFATGEFKTMSGAIDNMSMLTLPLSDDGTNVNMAVSSLAACLNFDVTASTDWLKGARVKVHYVTDVHDVAELEKRCLEWGRDTAGGNDAAEDVPQ